MRLISSLILAGSTAVITACAPTPSAAPETPAAEPDGGEAPAWRCDAEGARSLIGLGLCTGASEAFQPGRVADRRIGQVVVEAR